MGKLVDAREAAWPCATILTGSLVRLEVFLPKVHGDALWEATGGAHNAALWQYLSDGPFQERAQFDVMLAHMAEQKDPCFYAIVNQQSGGALGYGSLLNIRPNHRSLEIGSLMFSTAMQQTVSATEALYLFARYAFDELRYRRYEWKCNALNSKSRAAAERFGFTFEGIFRSHMIVKGRDRDSAWFSILEDEWPRVKSALEDWLSPDNFDDSGRQRRRLADLRLQWGGINARPQKS